MRRLAHVGVLVGVLLALAGAFLVTWSKVSAAPRAPVTVTATPAVPVFTPRVSLVHTGQTVVFTNATSQEMQVRTTPHGPAAFQLDVPANGSARLRLSVPGLYHYYDAATAHVIDFQANTDVVHPLPGAPDPHLPNEGWLAVVGAGDVPFDRHIDVPSLHDLLTPRAVVVRVGGSIVVHNHDTDAHNIVTDPGDPTGAAFELLGTDGEPAIGGAERRITFTKPGLYHLYCTIHTRVVGQVGQWQVVVPRDSNASGYADMDAMEAWVLVIQ